MGKGGGGAGGRKNSCELLFFPVSKEQKVCFLNCCQTSIGLD